MDKTEFLRRRKYYVCASDISALAGVNPYRTAVDIYLDKINPDLINEEVSETAYFSGLLDSVIAEEYITQGKFYRTFLIKAKGNENV